MFTVRVTSMFTPLANQICISGIFSNASVHGSHLMANRRTPLCLLPESPPSLLPQPIKHASLEYFQMQCSWVISHGQ